MWGKEAYNGFTYEIQGPVSRKYRERFGPGKPFVRLQSACFENWADLFEHARKTKRIAKFDGLEPERCENVKGIVAPETGQKSFETFEKQALGHELGVTDL